jgi:predicted nucleic acid-binding protein
VALILDTSVTFAILDRSDRAHPSCRSLIESTDEALVLPSPTLPEISYLASRSIGPGAMVALLRDIVERAYEIADLLPPDYVRVGELMDRYSDLDVGFVDAAVLAVTERLGEPKLATLDHRHFGVLRPRHVETLELLPA